MFMGFYLLDQMYTSKLFYLDFVGSLKYTPINELSSFTPEEILPCKKVEGD